MVHPKVDKTLLPVGESRTFIMGIFAREVKGREQMVMTKWGNFILVHLYGWKKY
jgi:hypothetical protein